MLEEKRLADLLGLVDQASPIDNDLTIHFCEAILKEEPSTARAYSILATAKRRAGMGDTDSTAPLARNAGLALVAQGKLNSAAEFFEEVSRSFPDLCRGYALLYRQIENLSAAAHSMMQALHGDDHRKPLVIGLCVWGTKFTDLFTRYSLPALLSPGNLPAVGKVRDVIFEICATSEAIEEIKESQSYRVLQRYAKAVFIPISQEILDSSEYRDHVSYKYNVYAGFHHVSIIHARAIGGDVICFASDNVHSDGALANYVRYIDQGYLAVLLTGMKTQAESVLPILDGMRNEAAQSITVTPRRLVALNAAYIHHNFKYYLLTKDNRHVPIVPSLTLMFFPNKHGFHGRCFHLYPIIFAAEAIQKDISFDYSTVDSTALSRIFPGPQDWNKIKVIEHSDDGVLLDLAFTHPEIEYQRNEFHRDQLLKQAPSFLPVHFWNFGHRIVYYTDDELDTIGTYDRQADGHLERRLLPVSSVVDDADDELAAWFEAHRPK